MMCKRNAAVVEEVPRSVRCLRPFVMSVSLVRKPNRKSCSTHLASKAPPMEAQTKQTDVRTAMKTLRWHSTKPLRVGECLPPA